MDKDRILSMSAFEAALLIRRFREQNPDKGTSELIQLVRAIRSDFYTHDYEAGSALERIVPASIEAGSLEEFFTATVESIITQFKPMWVRLAPAGRSHVLQAIGVNGQQCLRAAGLLSTSERVTAWWDTLANFNRGERDARLLAQGRKGERLSLAYEGDRLKREGIPRQPVWVAIDDNTVGFDIKSFSVTNGHESNRLIEVKTTTAEPARMILSRNEWKIAEQFGDAFEFHIWELSKPTLTILSIDQVRPHIPVDHGRGKWQNVEIRPLAE